MWQSVINLKNRCNLIFYFFSGILLHILILLILGWIFQNRNIFANDSLNGKFIRVYRKPIEINLKFRKREVEITDDDIIEIIKRKKRKRIIKKEIKPIVIPFEFKKRYIDLVYEKIEENKFYPEIERERGHQGDVYIKFTILKNGNIKNLKIVKKCNYKYLNRAAVETVKSSVPFPPLPDKMDEMKILINIAFKLE